MDLHAITSLPSQSQKDAYLDLFSTLSSESDMKTFISHISDQSLGLVVSRPVLADLIPKLHGNQELLAYTLDQIGPRAVSFEEQVCQLREALADFYESHAEFLEAARVLQGISLESGQRFISDDYKIKIYIRIIRCLLEQDEAIAADTYLNRATLLIHTSHDPEIQLHFKLAQARIFDAKRRFIEASGKYHELSYSPLIPESEREACLAAGMTCGVLAPAGPTRSRLLATLYKDERCAQLPNFHILEKMFLDHLITPLEVTVFAKGLKAHQLALLADGTTVLSRAVIEHNLLAVSKLYENIGFVELGRVLGVEKEGAERYARRMIESGRLRGEIDQVDSLLEFIGNGPGFSGAASSVGTAPGAVHGAEKAQSRDDVLRETQRWDSRIARLLHEAESIAGALEKSDPEWIRSRITVV